MKKIFVLLLATVLLAGVVAAPASATYADLESTDFIQGGTTAYDLTAYGSHIFVAYKVQTAPTPDGVIGTGEYPAPSDVSTLSDGLSLTDTSGSASRAEYIAEFEDGGFTLTTYIVYDDTYAYIAEVLDTTKPISVVQSNGRAGTLITHLNIGLNQAPEVPNHYSNLTFNHTYNQTNTEDFFDPAGFELKNVSALALLKRDIYTKAGNGNTTISETKNQYVDANETEWKPSEYAKEENNGVGGSFDGTNYQYVFEYRIPLGDPLRVAAEETTLESLLAKDVFYGSFFFQVAITRALNNKTNQIFLSAGKSKADTLTSFIDPEKTTTYGQAIADYWPVSNAGTNDAGSNAVNYLPGQIWFVGAYDPANPYKPVTSGIRPILTGVALTADYTGVRAGKEFTFNPVADCAGNPNPSVGDQRMVPTSWQIRFNNSVFKKGAIEDKGTGDFTTTISTKGFYTGLHTLTVPYQLQSFNGSSRVNLDSKETIARSFTVTGGVRAATGASAQTGDSLTWLWISLGVVTVAAAAVVVFVVSRRRRSI